MTKSTGILAHENFLGSILFIDHYSDFWLDYLITDITSLEILEVKQAYERFMLVYYVTLKLCHFDNLRSNNNNFRSDCTKAGKKLTHCDVGAHHQNQCADIKIKLVCYRGRNVRLHAKHK